MLLETVEASTAFELPLLPGTLLIGFLCHCRIVLMAEGLSPGNEGKEERVAASTRICVELILVAKISMH